MNICSFVKFDGRPFAAPGRRKNFSTPVRRGKVINRFHRVSHRKPAPSALFRRFSESFELLFYVFQQAVENACGKPLFQKRKFRRRFFVQTDEISLFEGIRLTNAKTLFRGGAACLHGTCRISEYANSRRFGAARQTAAAGSSSADALRDVFAKLPFRYSKYPAAATMAPLSPQSDLSGMAR